MIARLQRLLQAFEAEGCGKRPHVLIMSKCDRDRLWRECAKFAYRLNLANAREVPDGEMEFLNCKVVIRATAAPPMFALRA